MFKARFLVRALATIAVCGVILLPLAFTPTIKALQLDLNGIGGWGLCFCAVFGSLIAWHAVIDAVVKRAGGSVRVNWATYLAGKVGLFLLIAGALLLLGTAFPQFIAINSAAGLLILYGAIGLTSGTIDLVDAYIVAKYKEKDALAGK